MARNAICVCVWCGHMLYVCVFGVGICYMCVCLVWACREPSDVLCLQTSLPAGEHVPDFIGQVSVASCLKAQWSVMPVTGCYMCGSRCRWQPKRSLLTLD